MFKAIATALVLSITFTTTAKADLFQQIVGAIIVGTVLNELTKDDSNPVNNTHEDNIELWDEVTKRIHVISESEERDCARNQGLFGMYYPGHNVMLICDGHTYNNFYETLRHEAMHLIQDCNAGINNDKMITSFTASSLHEVETRRTQQWLAGYDVDYHVRMLESEAFHYEVMSSKLVTKLLRERC